MYMDWTKHLPDPEAKAKFEQSALSSRVVLERLTELINERVHEMDKAEMSLKSFDTPNWAEKQAFRNGFRSLANIVTKLIDLDQQKVEYQS